MSNTGVRGTVNDEQGSPLSGVVAYVRRRWNTSEFALELGSGTSNQAGVFEVHYAAIDDQFLQLEVELTDLLGLRRMAPVRLFASVTAQTLDTGVWEVALPEVSGWIATTGAFQPTAGNAIDLLVDNEAAWAAVLDAVNGAQTTINFMLFYLDVDHTFMTFTLATPNAGKSLEEALKSAGARGVTVRLLLNDFIGLGKPLPLPCDTADVVSDAFSAAPGVETRRFRMVPVAPVHAKVLIVDRIVGGENLLEAYLIGSPFVQDYFDGPAHSLHDLRHGEERVQKAINVPTHDVSIRLRGPAIAHLDETFCLHWNQVRPTGTDSLAAAPAPAARTGTDVVTAQLTRSLWGAGLFPLRPQGETSIYEAYLRAIANAEQYVYLENQYFTCRELAKALTRAVKDKPNLQVILVTNNKVDIPLYSGWHPANVSRLLTGLTEAERQRVGVFTLWMHEPGEPAGSPDRVGRIYVHSKVAIIDDKWATVGSANLDGVSLLLSEHADVFSRQDVRATEANIVVLGAAAGGTATDLPARLRKLLWAEHLGLTASGPPENNVSMLDGNPPPDGWLGLWNRRVTAKLGSLLSTPVTVHAARILPWPHKDGLTLSGSNNTVNYLEACDIKPAGSPPSFEIVETFDFYDFKTGAWQ